MQRSIRKINPSSFPQAGRTNIGSSVHKRTRLCICKRVPGTPHGLLTHSAIRRGESVSADINPEEKLDQSMALIVIANTEKLAKLK
jgi:hypothetical protein